MKKAKVYILSTGGTITGSGDLLSAEYKAAVLSPDDLVCKIPKIAEVADIVTEQISNIGSQDMDYKIWIKIAKRVNEIFNQNLADAIVVLHGTDTLEESAYFLNLVVKSHKTVVLTGSMRNPNALASDAFLNLFNAVVVAANKNSSKKGVLVVMNGEIHAAREVIKTDTTALQSFKSPNSGKIGTVFYLDVKFYLNPLRKHTLNSEFNIDEIEDLPKVDIVYLYANDSSEFINAAVKNGARGIVLAGLGNGNFSSKMEKSLKNATNKGIIIVRSSRVCLGEITQDGEVECRDFIPSDNLNPQKARVLLMLGILKNKTKIRDYFAKY